MANELPGEIKGPIDTVLRAFNTKQFASFTSVFAPEATIGDGFAPFRWAGSDAPARWWKDAEKWAHELNVASEHIAVQAIHHSQIVGTRAYAVLSATLTITLQKGQPIRRPGILVYTLVRIGEEWKVESQTWGRLG